MDVAAKTGTTDDNYDRWLCGFTNYYTAVTWYGYDLNEEISYSGHQNPASVIWSNVMQSIHSELPSSTFEKPSDVVSERICSSTGNLATSNCSNTYTEYFLRGTVPKQCKQHTSKNSSNLNEHTNTNTTQNTSIDASNTNEINTTNELNNTSNTIINSNTNNSTINNTTNSNMNNNITNNNKNTTTQNNNSNSVTNSNNSINNNTNISNKNITSNNNNISNNTTNTNTNTNSKNAVTNSNTSSNSLNNTPQNSTIQN